MIPRALQCVCTWMVLGTSQLSAADAALQRLEREMQRLANNSGMIVGASALHVESDRRASLRGDERFPMASTYKIPIAVQLLTRIDKGELRLDEMVTVAQNDLHPGSGTLSDLFTRGGLALSVQNLLELMLLISDNSATDILLRLAGGPRSVTERMRSIGIEGMEVSRPTVEAIADWAGLNLPRDRELSVDLFRTSIRQVSPDARKAAAARFDSDSRDTASPNAMADLLVRIHRKQILKADTTDLLLDIMRRCRTGEARIKGILPAGTEVKHKTGTLGGSTNDVGIITLPDDTGHVALAIFIKSSEKEAPARERTIAEIARAVHDFFLFQRSSVP